MERKRHPGLGRRLPGRSRISLPLNPGYKPPRAAPPHALISLQLRPCTIGSRSTGKPREKHMKRQTISWILTAGTAAILLAAPSLATAQERGSVQGVIHDAYGNPIAGAFVKLKNDERRLTFMVVSREQGQFEAKDLPPGQYRVQGVAGANQSDWFTKVQVTSGGSAKVGLALTHHRGPMLQPAWPQRIPEAQADKVVLELPDGDGKALVQEKCTSCHDLRRTLVKRSNRDHWAHTVARMRTRMSVASIPDLSE